MGNLTNEQLIFLDNLIYLNFGKIVNTYIASKEELTVGQLIKEIFNDFDTCSRGNIACMNQIEWSNLLKSFMYEYIGDDENGNPVYSEDKLNQTNIDFLENYVIEQYDDEATREGLEEEGFRACCFVKRNDIDEVEDVVAIFRETAGDTAEWEDNVLNANRVWSYEMDKSVWYINSLPAEYGNNITVSGHSKGGNRAHLRPTFLYQLCG